MIRAALMAAVLCGSCCLSQSTGWALDLRSGVPPGDIEVTLDVVVEQALDPATEFAFIDLVPFPDGTGRLAVSAIQGTIRVIDAAGNLLPTPLMTKAQSGTVLPQEAGMTGIAFHPDFNNAGTFGYGKLYTITTERRGSQGGVPMAQVDFPFTNENYQDVIREWDLSTFGEVPGNASNNSFSGTRANSREIMRVAQPGPFHNVPDLTFNTSAAPNDPDYGILYISAGDGGNPAGMSVSQGGNFRALGAQDLSTIYGNVLRINPNPTAHALVRTSALTGQPSYSIPSDNPFYDDAADGGTETRSSSTLAEIWANGLRSPWRMTFDRETGEMYIGDVGEDRWEEINRIKRAENYGWGQMEGSQDGTFISGDGTLLPGLTRPIVELPHDTASDSITGGFVYRGSALPELVGKYVFADLGQNYQSSAIFYAIVDPDDPDGEVGEVFEFQLSPLAPKFENNTQLMPERIFSVGEDEAGELYLMAGPDPRQPFDPNRPSLVLRLAAAPYVPLLGDFNDDGLVNATDWVAFKAGQGSNFSGKTLLEARAMGDLDGDFDHDLEDFIVFRVIYEQQNGAGSFAALTRHVPEPTTFSLAACWCLPLLGYRGRR
jgi:glucose/arabinose dehydrogenase